jgi:hypothetical protein
MIFALDLFLKQKKSWTIYSVMTLGFLILIPAVISRNEILLFLT